MKALCKPGLLYFGVAPRIRLRWFCTQLDSRSCNITLSRDLLRAEKRRIGLIPLRRKGLVRYSPASRARVRPATGGLVPQCRNRFGVLARDVAHQSFAVFGHEAQFRV
jgi:hypothetical protein